jgi:adenosine deaminase
LLRVDLPGEYGRCAETFGWNAEIGREIAANSIRASFANSDAKASMLAKAAAW